MIHREGRAFASREQLAAWLKKNHATSSELWVRMFKKGSGRPSVTWEDCVVVARHNGTDGRKHGAVTALFTASGELLGLARAIWIEPRS